MSSSAAFKPPPKEEYHRFLANIYGVDSSGNLIDPSIDTRCSRRYDGTQTLYESGSRLADGKSVLNDCIATLRDPDAYKYEAKAAINIIEKTIVPLMDAAAGASIDAAKKVAPIARSVYAHKRDQTRRAREAKEAAKNKDDAKLAMIHDYIDNQGLANGSSSTAKIRTVTPATKKSKRSSKKRKALPPTISLPEPHQGDTYGVGEFLDIACQYKRGSKERRLVIDMARETKRVKRGKVTIYRTINAYEEGREQFQFNQPWKNNGRNPVLNDAKVDKCCKDIANDLGEKTMEEKVNDMLVQALREKGLRPPPGYQFNRTTISNYKAYFASKGIISLTDDSIDKTDARRTAEKSLISSMALLIVVALTHFYVAEVEDTEWREFITKLSPEDRKLYDMVSDFHGGKPVRYREPHRLFGCDDSTEFATEGTQPNDSKKVGLVGKSSLITAGTRSIFHTDTSKKNRGMRVKRHKITCGNGSVAPVVYAFCGLTEHEMPKDDVILWKVEGLCPGGFGVNGSTKVGYVLWMRGFKGAEELRFRIIRDIVLFPFIHACGEGRAVLWGDGDNSWLKTVTSKEGIAAYAENDVIVNKHNGSRTGAEATCDLDSLFKIEHNYNRTTTVMHIPKESHDLKASLDRRFVKDYNDGRLRIKKKNIALDYLAKAQTTLTVSCLPEGVVKGLTANGFLDPTHRRIAVLEQIIGTIRRIPTEEEYALIFRTFPTLMGLSYHNGLRYLADEEYIALGFPADINGKGQEKIRPHAITLEPQHRAKILTAPAEVTKRTTRKVELEVDAQRKKDEKLARASQKVTEDAAVVAELCSFANKPASDANAARFCTLEHFAKLQAPKLRKYILGRHPHWTREKDISFLKKPRTALQDANAGHKNLVSVAMEVRQNKSRYQEAADAAESAEAEAARAEEESPNAANVDDILRGRSFLLPLTAPAVDFVQPSAILGDSNRMDIFARVFDPEDKLRKVEITDDNRDHLLAKANAVFKSMSTKRFDLHMRKVLPEQRRYMCLRIAKKNLALVAVHMLSLGRLKGDVSCLDKSKCILSSPGDNYLPVGSDTNDLGCYLHWNKNDEVFARSGSAVGEGGIAKRNKTHLTKAKSDRNDDESLFYHLYPHSTSIRANNDSKNGIFEHLVPLIATSLSRDAALAGLLSKDFSEGGIFFYTEEEKEYVRKCFPGRTEEEKFIQMAAYIFEFGYDLALALRHNVSESPGFEGCGLKAAVKMLATEDIE